MKLHTAAAFTTCYSYPEGDNCCLGEIYFENKTAVIQRYKYYLYPPNYFGQ